jgi:hypothetical protein
MTSFRCPSTVFALLFLAGCADAPHRFNETAWTSTHPKLVTLTTGADQRVVQMSYMPGATTTTPAFWRSCSEGSPDAISSLTRNVGASLEKNEVAAASFASSVASQMASIGLRTQSITLWRDEAFRICEGYINAAISPIEFDFFHRRIENMIMASMAIEQLTGVLHAPSASTSGVDSSALTTAVTTGYNNLQAAEKDLTQDKAALDAAKKADTAGSTTDTQKNLTDAQTKEKASEDAVTKATDDLAKATAALASGTAPKAGVVDAGANAAALPPATVDAVEKIVGAALSTDYVADLCYHWYTSQNEYSTMGDPDKKALSERCAAQLEYDTKASRAAAQKLQ